MNFYRANPRGEADPRWATWEITDGHEVGQNHCQPVKLQV